MSSGVEVKLAAESIDQLAERLAELLGDHSEPPELPSRLTAAEVARWWEVSRRWVYAHADELGARRLGSGDRPRLRFDPKEVEERMGKPHHRPSTADWQRLLPGGGDG